MFKENWYSNEANRKITFITKNESCTYEVFSVYQIENEEYYITTDFKNEEFAKFVKTIKSRSITDFDVEVTEEDNILTLSTCADNNKYRIVGNLFSISFEIRARNFYELIIGQSLSIIK